MINREELKTAQHKLPQTRRVRIVIVSCFDTFRLQQDNTKISSLENRIGHHTKITISINFNIYTKGTVVVVMVW